MKIRNKILILAVVTAVLISGYFKFFSAKKAGGPAAKEIRPTAGDFQIKISTTGVVEPQNRLEIKPPIDGRIDEIYVKEGDGVKQGQVLALMSSTDRAALLDAARAQGEEAVAYWQDAYKATPLISPIDGEIIVRAVEPGQTVVSSEAVLVLSDRLIVKAQVDETDIGRVKVRQKALLSLDAYPEQRIEGVVGHIAYESQLANNVTIYEVDIVPSEVPAYFRSGMSATIEIIEKESLDTLIIPLAAVIRQEDGDYLLIKNSKTNKREKIKVECGLEDNIQVEVVSGLKNEDIVIIEKDGYIPPKQKSGSSPFMPQRRR
ncbi:efflux RND transporter periplasmic adaptor subunit [Candidatus Omnitrophota bacterium]